MKKWTEDWMHALKNSLNIIRMAESEDFGWNGLTFLSIFYSFLDEFDQRVRYWVFLHVSTQCCDKQEVKLYSRAVLFALFQTWNIWCKTVIVNKKLTNTRYKLDTKYYGFTFSTQIHRVYYRDLYIFMDRSLHAPIHSFIILLFAE
jgi:hypothetical protein